jgi:hypothetical protein
VAAGSNPRPRTGASEVPRCAPHSMQGVDRCTFRGGRIARLETLTRYD